MADTLGTIYPGGRRFNPKAGSWLEDFIKDTAVKSLFVSAEEDNDLIIGTIQRTGTKFRQRYFKKPVRVTSSAKTVPTIDDERITASISSAVWDLRRRHGLHKVEEPQAQ